MDTSADVLRTFITAGQAVFTIRSRETGTRFTYKVDRIGNRQSFGDTKFFVSILTGPDNTRDFAYAGLLIQQPDGHLIFRQTRKSKVTDAAASWRGFAWLVRCINAGHDIVLRAEFDPEGKCGRCGRPLTVPESIRTGLGPVCAARVAS